MTESAKKPRLSPAQWAEIEVKWRSGEYTLSMLEEEYGTRSETFSRYFKKKGIAKGSDSVGEMIRESLKSDAEIRARARAQKVESRKEEYDKWAIWLSGLTINQIATAKKEGRSLSLVEDDIKALQRAAAVVQKCFDVSSRALGLEKDDVITDEIPNLV
ncbi:DNA-binding protein, partial [Klebsiella variicola]|nr:DNA-binding protein [Klebsiella variicola]